MEFTLTDFTMIGVDPGVLRDSVDCLVGRNAALDTQGVHAFLCPTFLRGINILLFLIDDVPNVVEFGPTSDGETAAVAAPLHWMRRS